MRRASVRSLLGLMGCTLGMLVPPGCGGNGGGGGGGTLHLTIPPNVAWLNTGITMTQLKNVEISAPADAAGFPYVVTDDPIPYLGHRRLLGRIGPTGIPFDVGTSAVLNGDTFNAGEPLFLGRNDMDYVTAADRGGDLTPLPVDVTVTDNPGAPLLAPEDNIWSNNASPTFVWENLERASEYVLVVSRYPDFRTVELSTTVTTGQTTGTNFVPGTPASTTPQTALTEGLHYWRVRAQVNPCRDLNPCFVWKDWSLTYAYGVELGNPLQAPVYLSPATDAVLEVGTPAILEFLSPPSPSGALWRLRADQAPCGGTPTINSSDPSSGHPTDWRVFPGTYNSPDPQQPPFLYASYTTGPLSTGEWLFRIEVRKISDFQAQNVSSADLQLSIGCQ